MSASLTHGPLLWFLNRGTGVAVLALLTVTVALGVLTARPIRARWVPAFVTRQLHRNIAVISLALVALHAASAVVDTYVNISWWQALSPVGGTYKPFWLGLGALAFDVMLVVALSTAIRSRLSQRTWRAVHLAGYAAWPIALVHSYGIGTDAVAPWARWFTLGCVGLVGLCGAQRLVAERQFKRIMPEGVVR